MDCHSAQEMILESLDEVAPAEARRILLAHVKECVSCAQFAERQALIDRGLAEVLIPPVVSTTFRQALRRRIASSAGRPWPDWLPDAVHFISCGTVTGLCAVLLPFDATTVLTLGVVGTALTHILLAAARGSLDAADDIG